MHDENMNEELVKAVLDEFNRALDDFADSLEPISKDNYVRPTLKAIRNRSRFSDPQAEVLVMSHMLAYLAGDLRPMGQTVYGMPEEEDEGTACSV